MYGLKFIIQYDTLSGFSVYFRDLTFLTDPFLAVKMVFYYSRLECTPYYV
jgi:hypothetical protein